MPIAFINSTTASAASGSTWTLPTHSWRVGGAAFIVCLNPASSAVTVSTITDNTTNIYRKAVAVGSPKPAVSAEIWYATNISSASTGISVLWSAASSGNLGIGQFDGVSTANALDVTGSSAITANSTSHSAQTVTPSTANCLVVTCARVTASTISPIRSGANYTAFISTGVQPRTHCMYWIQGTPTATDGPWTNGGATTSTGTTMHAEAIAVFFDTAAGGGGGGSPTVLSGGLLLCGVQ